jgi:hypothetical protein
MGIPLGWINIVTRATLMIPTLVATVQKIKNAKGQEKHDAVAASVEDFLGASEFIAGKDLFNDANILKLRDEAIAAEKAALRAREAFKAGLINKALPPAQADAAVAAIAGANAQVEASEGDGSTEPATDPVGSLSIEG